MRYRVDLELCNLHNETVKCTCIYMYIKGKQTDMHLLL